MKDIKATCVACDRTFITTEVEVKAVQDGKQESLCEQCERKETVMEKKSNGWRSKPEDMKSLGFDVYIYAAGKNGKHGGRIICRKTKDDFKFNDYKKETLSIVVFMNKQYEKEFEKCT